MAKRQIDISSVATTHAVEDALRTIEEALTDISTHPELDMVGALLQRRWNQLNAQADFRSIVDNGFEPGDPVVYGGNPQVYKIVRVGERSLTLTDGKMLKVPAKTEKGVVEKLSTISIQARHVRLADRLFKEARKAHQKLGG